MNDCNDEHSNNEIIIYSDEQAQNSKKWRNLKKSKQIWKDLKIRSAWSKIDFRLKFMLTQDWRKFLTKVLTKKVRATLSRI